MQFSNGCPVTRLSRPLAALLFLLTGLALSGCGAQATATRAPAAKPPQAAPAVSAKGDFAKLTTTQARQALSLIGERLYGKDILHDFARNDSALFKKGLNNQGNQAWIVARAFWPTQKDGQYAFLANEYTKDEAGVMQTQYKVSGTVDLKANEVVAIMKEVEDRDPR